MERARKIRKVLINVGILLTTTVMAIGIGELFVRTLYENKIVLYPRYHTDAQYGEFTLRKIRPNSEFWHKSVDGSWRFVTNGQGFRNYVDFEYEKAPDTIRVLSLGDSHTQGYEVRQGYTFSAVLERYLLRENYKAEVINAGISGFSTAEELVFLENAGIKYQPDFVVLGFFRNDVEDNIKAGLFKLSEENNLIVAKKKHIPGVRIQNIIYELPGVKWLSENSYLYSLAFNTTWNFFKNRLARQSSENITEYAVATRTTFSDYQIKLASRLILRMHDFCETNGIKLIVVDIPSRRSGGKLESSIRPLIASDLGDSGVAYIDTTSMLSDYSGVAELQVPNGHRHISEFTHTMLGVAIGKKIKSFIEKDRGS